ncbi:MAG TPA: NAD(P)-dependent oxidoreductase [Stellaceae bacterium]|nr:NAD(P)-dependent oxidoreductase [Stellaceae bacterium]
MERLLKFAALARTMPEKRPAAERLGDFREIFAGFRPEAAKEQASRCSQCGVPFCQVHCPLGNQIPDWLMLTAEGRLEEAYALAAATNNMPEVCGRICPQDRLCEGHCVVEAGFEAVTIGSIESFITETAFANGWVVPPKPVREHPHSIGVIGAGPAGLAAAEQLRQKGYAVHVYDRYDRVGGLLVYGIPNFKLEKSVVARRHALLAEGGIHFHLKTAVGVDVSLAALRARHDALLIATGVYRARTMACAGIGLGNVVPALDYLIAANRRGLGDAVPSFDSGMLNAAGKHVVVVGGGDTAMDCVRTAVRQGAQSVRCLYRRDRKNMPGSAREVRHAEEEGVEFVWLAAPEALLGDGHLRAIRAQRMHLGVADAGGRQVAQPLPGGHFELEADLVIMALGFDADDMPALFDAPELAVTPTGTIRIDRRTLMTSLDGVFAAGDIVRGASLVVWAIRDGRDAAEEIHRYVQEKAAVLAVAAE